jgi:hypothetical protein
MGYWTAVIEDCCPDWQGARLLVPKARHLTFEGTMLHSIRERPAQPLSRAAKQCWRILLGLDEVSLLFGWQSI